jgi:hypothetical protein
MADEPDGADQPRPPDSSPELDAARREIETAHAKSVFYGGEPVELTALPRTNDYLDQVDREQDINLKRTYARRLLWLLTFQMAIADGVFVAYAQVGVHWALTPQVIDAWLGATLIEVVGIVLVVTRYLFPRRDFQQ